MDDCKCVDFAWWWSNHGEGNLPLWLPRLVFLLLLAPAVVHVLGDPSGHPAFLNLASTCSVTAAIFSLLSLSLAGKLSKFFIFLGC